MEPHNLPFELTLRIQMLSYYKAKAAADLPISLLTPVNGTCSSGAHDQTFYLYDARPWNDNEYEGLTRFTVRFEQNHAGVSVICQNVLRFQRDPDATAAEKRLRAEPADVQRLVSATSDVLPCLCDVVSRDRSTELSKLETIVFLRCS